MKDKTKKILSAILCLVLGAIIGFCCGLAVNGSADKQTSINEDGNAIINSGESHGIKLTSAKIASGASGTGYLITATVTPVTAIAVLDWTVDFSRSTDTWAKGKTATDYLKVTPTSDGALTARAECLQAFGTPLTIKATSRSDENIFATCTVDYAKRFTTAEATFSSTGFTICDDEKTGENVIIPLYNFTTGTPYWRDAESKCNTAVYCNGLGTVTPEIVSAKTEFKVSETFLQLYNSAPYYRVNGNTTECLYKDWYAPEEFKSSFADLIDNLSKPFAQNGGWCNEDDYAGFLKALKTYNSTDFYVRITATVKYGENSADETVIYPCMFYRGSEVFKASSLALDKSNLIC